MVSWMNFLLCVYVAGFIFQLHKKTKIVVSESKVHKVLLCESSVP